MSTELTPAQKLGIDEHIYSALKNSLYPGAADESIMMVLSYCKAAKLDPLLKPVHLVPMYVTDKTKPKNEKGYHPQEWRDTVMEGIGLHRIKASRTGKYIGLSAPLFGEDVKEKLGSKEINYPKTCTMTIKRKLDDGTIAEWTITQRWIENYASKGKDDPTPNAMWSKRPYAQLAKCTEAQCLRTAFPELGSQPTAEEMEGKQLDNAFDDEPKANPAELLANKLKSNTQPLTQITPNAGNKNIDIENITKKINDCKTSQDMEPIFSEINNIKNFSDKKNLMTLYKKKLSDFESYREEKTAKELSKEFFGEENKEEVK